VAAVLVDTLVRVEMVHQEQLQRLVLAVAVAAVLLVTLAVLEQVAVAVAVPVYLVKALMERRVVRLMVMQGEVALAALTVALDISTVVDGNRVVAADRMVAAVALDITH
jgi:hypothetical protein